MTETIVNESVNTATGTEAASPGQTASAPETTTSIPTQTAGSSTPQAETGAVTPAAYTPNYKYKVFGKEAELEEFWRPLIKDQDSEKKVKDLFTRAEAFNDLKERFEGTQQEFSKIYNEYQALDADVRKVTSFLNKGDFDNFFSAIGVNQEQIFKWVADKLEQENLPPEQKRALQAQQLERQRLYDLEMEKTALEQQYQQQAVQARAMQLEMVLSRPEVAQVASAWDSRLGTLGAFRDLVIEEAQKAWYVQGKDLSAEQAVQAVLTKYGKMIDTGAMTPQAFQPQAPTGQSSSPQVTQKPVIPAVQGRGTSPVKKSPNSLDELRKMAKEVGA